MLDVKHVLHLDPCERCRYVTRPPSPPRWRSRPPKGARIDTVKTIRWNHVLPLAACLLVAALWIDFSEIHRFHNSDTVLMALISLYRWTPLVWEQDRFGMLFPLLATPWKHPLDNLLAQGAMTTLASLSGFYLLGYYVAGRGRGMVIGAVGAISLILCLDLGQRFAYFINLHNFATSSAIGLAGLILLDRWARGHSARWAAAAVACIAMAHWVNPGLAFALGPLLVVRRLCFRGLEEYFERFETAQLTGGAPPLPPWRMEPHDNTHGWLTRWIWHPRPGKDEIVGLLAIGVALVATMIQSRSASYRQHYHLLPPRDWLLCALEMGKNLNEFFPPRWFLTIGVTALIGAATFCWPEGRRAARVSLRVAAGLLFVAAVQYAFMSSIDHVLANHSARYTLMAVFFWQAALVSFAVIQVGAVLPLILGSRRLHVALPLAMTLAVAVTHGWPSRGVVRAAIDRSCGRYTDDVLAAGCTHLAGNYWHVWTTMFHANLRLADQQPPRRVWGISHRCEPTARYWRQILASETRIGEIVGDEAQSAVFRQLYRAPSVVAREQVGAVRVLCPFDVAPGAVASSVASSAGSSAGSATKKTRDDPRLGDALVVRPR
jgi:hypothetical protein